MKLKPFVIVLSMLINSRAPAQDTKPDIEHFTVRAGYKVTVAVPDLPAARFLAFDDRGTLYVSRPDRGDIVAFKDPDKDGVYQTQTEFITGKPFVQAMCFKDGWLWFATTGSVHKARDTGGTGKADEVVDVIPIGKLPAGSGHWWRSLLITGDAIYTSIGDSGNASDLTDTDREKIWKYDLDGSNKRLFCSGIRNTEKLLIRPALPGSPATPLEPWGFDHGSDNFAYDLGEEPGRQPVTDLNPPDELNHYTEGGFYGHPFIVGNRIPRYEYAFGPGKRSDIDDIAGRTIVPEWCVPAHWAVNGFTFIDPDINERTHAFPADHNADIFFAAHGSWNSDHRVGYCVARILFDNGKPYGMLKIVKTLEAENEVVRARPVDCAQAPDGSILFSADQPGRVYRIRYVGKP
jgi:glucose/arabinose dehydrogenase